MIVNRSYILFICLFICSAIGNAQQSTASAKATDNSASANLQSYRQNFWDSLPKPDSWTNDYEDLFSDDQQMKLDSVIAAFEKETGVEICIVTLDTNCVEAGKFDDLALRIANNWGVGRKEKNDGVTICISKGYRRMRICNGYGIEKVFTDAETKQIIDSYFIPPFKQADYYKGTFDGLQALITILRDRTKNI